MEFRVLTYFLAVAREESISAAAEFLHITQPTLSRQIKDLEEELGKQLFIRGNRKISLTEEGLLLRKRAEEIIQLVNKTELEINATDENISGEIHIGGGESEGFRDIAKIINTIHATYPDITFNIYSGNANDVTDKLDKGLLDFGILIEPADITKYDFIKLPAIDTWGLLMQKNSLLASKDTINADDLKGIPLMCSTQDKVREDISSWVGEDLDNFTIVANYNLIYNAAIMVEEGVGYALCLDKLINVRNTSDLCFKPLSPALDVGLVLVWKKYQILSKASQYFLNKVEELIKSNEQ